MGQAHCTHYYAERGILCGAERPCLCTFFESHTTCPACRALLARHKEDTGPAQRKTPATGRELRGRDGDPYGT